MRPLDQFLSIVHCYTPDNAYIGVSKLVFGAMRSKFYLGSYKNNLLPNDIRQDPKQNTYIRITPLKNKPSKGRGKEADSLGSSVLWIDYDCYNSQLEGFQALQALDKPPTLIVNSGRGLQAYWLLNAFCTDLEAIKSRNKALLNLFDKDAVDSCFDLARVLRVPETYNLKDPDRPVQCTILLYEPERIYSLEDFVAVPITQQTIEEWDQVELDPDFLDVLKEQDKKLYNRIYSEDTARKADAPLTAGGEIDRSKNDYYIASALLRLGYSPNEVLSVLCHSHWLSGMKYRITGRYDYVVSTVNEALTNYRNNPDRYFTKNRFEPKKVLEAFEAPERLFLYVNELLYRYENGVYKADGEAWVREQVAQRLGSKWTIRIALETVTYIEDTHRVSGDELNQHKGLINCINGMVNFMTGEVLPHSPNYLSLHQLPVSYMPGIVSSELDNFIAAILPHDAIDVWWEYVGSCFIQHQYWPKAFLALVGPGNTGKSKLLEWLFHFFGGKTNCAALSLQALADNRFAMAALFGKIANIFSDLDESEAKSVGQIKALTGDDHISGERKHKDHFFFKNGARLFFSANSYPQVRAPDEAFFSRAIIIPCTTKFYQNPGVGQRKADKDIVESLIKPDIFSAGLNRAIEGLSRLVKQNGFSKSASIEAAQAEYRFSADTVAGFLASCAYKPGYAISKQAMYQAYKQACEMGGRKPFSDDKFYKRVADIADRYGLGQEYNTVDGVRVWQYHNRQPMLHNFQPIISNIIKE
jgi:P4 family phage/plasmid primase-like protien